MSTSQDKPTDALQEWLICARTLPAPKQHTKMKWKIGDECRIEGQHIGCAPGRMYDAKILDTAFSSEGDYLQTKLEITASVTAFGQTVQQTWTHPKPVQSYKLRKPLLKGEI